METRKINTKANWWGVLMTTTGIIALGMIGYERMRVALLVSIGVIIVSGLMAWREVRRLGWPTHKKAPRRLKND